MEDKWSLDQQRQIPAAFVLAVTRHHASLEAKATNLRSVPGQDLPCTTLSFATSSGLRRRTHSGIKYLSYSYLLCLHPFPSHLVQPRRMGLEFTLHPRGRPRKRPLE